MQWYKMNRESSRSRCCVVCQLYRDNTTLVKILAAERQAFVCPHCIAKKEADVSRLRLQLVQRGAVAAVYRLLRGPVGM
jgi:hypothetical protein